MTKTMKINELISKLKEYDGKLTAKVWSNGKAYPISHVGQGHTDGVLGTYVSIVLDDDRNLVDLSKIWHDASEEPEDDFAQILYQEKIGTYGIIVKHDWDLVNISWEDFSSANLMSRWAYISDLLPKGGEL